MISVVRQLTAHNAYLSLTKMISHSAYVSTKTNTSLQIVSGYRGTVHFFLLSFANHIFQEDMIV